MEKLNITEALVRRVMTQVEPDVERLTGWSLDVDSLGVRVLPKNRGYEDILLARLLGAGVQVDGYEDRNIVEKLVEYIVEGNVIAAYEPSSSTVMVVGENVDDSNMDGLRLVLAHELVHRGQHLHHPELFERIDSIVRNVFRLLASEHVTMKSLLSEMRKIQSLMTLMESHAYYVQETLHGNVYPGARIESHFDLPSILMRTFGRRKLIQYTAQLPAIAQATETGTLQDLYGQVPPP